MLSNSGESSTLGTAGWDICCHCQWHTSQSHRPCHHRHCRREESWHIFFWSQTSRYSVQSLEWYSHCFLWCGILIFLMQIWLVCLFRSNCGAAGRDGSTCRPNFGLPSARRGEFLVLTVAYGYIKIFIETHDLHLLHLVYFKVLLKLSFVLYGAFILPERGDNLLSCWAAYGKERWDPQCQQKRHGVGNSIRYTDNTLMKLTYSTPECNLLAVKCLFILLCPHRSFFPGLNQSPEPVICQAEQSRHWPSSASCVLQGQRGSGAEEDEGWQQPGAGTDHSTHWRFAGHLRVTTWLSPTGQSTFSWKSGESP